MDYFDELEKNIAYYLRINEIKNKSKSKKRAKINKFFRKVECWNCNAFFHKVVLTKYHGILQVKCYGEKFEETKTIFFDFIASFEVEYDTNFEEDLEKLSDIFEKIHDFYEGCSYRLENEEPKKEYKEIVQTAKEIYKILENNDEVFSAEQKKKKLKKF